MEHSKNFITAQLCGCNNCMAIMLDMNGSNQPELSVNPELLQDMAYIHLPAEDGQPGSHIHKIWACPKCETDAYLTDILDEDHLDRFILGDQTNEDDEEDDRIFGTGDMVNFAFTIAKWYRSKAPITDEQLLNWIKEQVKFEEGDGSYEQYNMPVKWPDDNFPVIDEKEVKAPKFINESLSDDIAATIYKASAYGYDIDENVHAGCWELAIIGTSISELEHNEEGILNVYVYNEKSEAEQDINTLKALNVSQFDQI